MEKITPEMVLGHYNGLETANWSSWWVLWNYADQNGLMNPTIDKATDRAEKQLPPTNAHLKAARVVVNHACRQLGLMEF